VAESRIPRCASQALQIVHRSISCAAAVGWCWISVTRNICEIGHVLVQRRQICTIVRKYGIARSRRCNTGKGKMGEHVARLTSRSATGPKYVFAEFISMRKCLPPVRVRVVLWRLRATDGGVTGGHEGWAEETKKGAGLLAGCPGPQKSTCVHIIMSIHFLAFSLVVLMEGIGMGTWRAGDVQVTFALDCDRCTKSDSISCWRAA